MIFDLEKDSDIQKLLEYLLKSKDKTVDVKVVIQKRTDRQLRSIWLYCGLVAQDLNAAGLDIQILLEEDLEVSWTKELIMDIYWRTIQKTLFNTESTKDLKTNQVSEIFKELNRHLGKFGISTQFPNWDYNDSL